MKTRNDLEAVRLIWQMLCVSTYLICRQFDYINRYGLVYLENRRECILKLWFAYKHIYETYINIFKIYIIYIYINIYTSLTIVKYGYFEYFFWGHGRYFNLILKVLRSHWRILNIRVTWSNLRCKLLFRSLYGELPQSLSVLWRWLLGSVNWKNAQPKSWELCLIQQTYWRHKLGRWPLT